MNNFPTEEEVAQTIINLGKIHFPNLYAEFENMRRYFRGGNSSSVQRDNYANLLYNFLLNAPGSLVKLDTIAHCIDLGFCSRTTKRNKELCNHVIDAIANLILLEPNNNFSSAATELCKKLDAEDRAEVTRNMQGILALVTERSKHLKLSSPAGKPTPKKVL